MSPLGILIIIIVIILILLIISYFFSKKTVLQGMQNGQTASIISASSLNGGSSSSSTSVPSTNFAYSIWFYINNWNYRYGEPKVVFGRMGSASTAGSGSVNGVNGIDPCPSVVLGAVENNLTISLGCYPGANEEPTTPGGTTVVHTCAISNVPVQKWVNLTISVYGRSLDVYIDGKLVKTCLLPGIANVNQNANLYVTPMGGFDGWTAKLQYFTNPLNPQQVWNIYTQGYANSWSSSLGSYQVQLSLVENGTVQDTLTI
jgi:hypothetical protein